MYGCSKTACAPAPRAPSRRRARREPPPRPDRLGRCSGLQLSSRDSPRPLRCQGSFILRADYRAQAGDLVADAAPLTGIKVVDMTEALAGPYCAMLLGDLGADVIKVERPGIGDQARGWGPPFLDGESAYFLAVNRNKRSIELDIKDARRSRRAHDRLTDRADVFLTNDPRIELARTRRLDPDTLQALNPRLVYAAISGYGHTGPKADRGGYDIIAQGEAGLMALTGEPATAARAVSPRRWPISRAGSIRHSACWPRSMRATTRRRRRRRAIHRRRARRRADAAGSPTRRRAYFATGKRPPRLGNAHPT